PAGKPRQKHYTHSPCRIGAGGDCVGVQGDRAQIILLWALFLAARKPSRRLCRRDRLPCGSVVTGESRSGIAGIEGAGYRSVPRPPRAAWTGLNSVEPVRAGSAGSDAGHAEDQVEHAPDHHAETRPREDVQWKVRAEVHT